ncbi:MAG: VanZ family protein [Lachnospiraceae bacterium]|nr:VanZ family protein [Lachnospiraceae bacterium]
MRPAVKKTVKCLGVCLFGIYLVVLIYLLLFSEGYGRRTDGSVYSYNVYPFREISRYMKYRGILGTRNVILNLAGNVVGFMPFGLLLPVFLRNARSFWKVTLLSFEISALVEFSQLIFHVGCFDVDDMILNTLGGFLGYLLFAVVYRLGRNYWHSEPAD